MEFLNFTGESQSDFENNHLPNLDCEIFVENGLISHSFFEKSMKSTKCFGASLAMPETMMRSSLKQEVIRRMTNMH